MEDDSYHLCTSVMVIPAHINARENQSSSYIATKLQMPSEIKGKNRSERDKIKKEWNCIQAGEEVGEQKSSGRS